MRLLSSAAGLLLLLTTGDLAFATPIPAAVPTADAAPGNRNGGRGGGGGDRYSQNGIRRTVDRSMTYVKPTIVNRNGEPRVLSPLGGTRSVEGSLKTGIRENLRIQKTEANRIRDLQRDTTRLMQVEAGLGSGTTTTQQYRDARRTLDANQARLVNALQNGQTVRSNNQILANVLRMEGKSGDVLGGLNKVEGAQATELSQAVTVASRPGSAVNNLMQLSTLATEVSGGLDRNRKNLALVSAPFGTPAR